MAPDNAVVAGISSISPEYCDFEERRTTKDGEHSSLVVHPLSTEMHRFHTKLMLGSSSQRAGFMFHGSRRLGQLCGELLDEAYDWDRSLALG
jgi:hypothetical protein